MYRFEKKNKCEDLYLCRKNIVTSGSYTISDRSSENSGTKFITLETFLTFFLNKKLMFNTNTFSFKNHTFGNIMLFSRYPVYRLSFLKMFCSNFGFVWNKISIAIIHKTLRHIFVQLWPRWTLHSFEFFNIHC